MNKCTYYVLLVILVKFFQKDEIRGTNKFLVKTTMYKNTLSKYREFFRSNQDFSS